MSPVVDFVGWPFGSCLSKSHQSQPAPSNSCVLWDMARRLSSHQPNCTRGWFTPTKLYWPNWCMTHFTSAKLYEGLVCTREIVPSKLYQGPVHTSQIVPGPSSHQSNCTMAQFTPAKIVTCTSSHQPNSTSKILPVKLYQGPVHRNQILPGPSSHPPNCPRARSSHS